MFKLIKYELRATFLTIIGICITVIIASLLLMTRKPYWGPAVTGLSVTLTIGAIIVISISSLKIMSKYLYGDSGYLLFTLPQSGASILTSRLITALIQISIVSFVAITMCYLTVANEINFSLLKYVTVTGIIYVIIGYVWFIFSSFTFIYFCMVIGKVALKNKKLGKVGSFIIFILLSLAVSWLSFKLVSLFPQTIKLMDSPIPANYNSGDSGFTVTEGSFNMNIAKTLFDAITFAVLFISSSYLIDKKLDLS